MGGMLGLMTYGGQVNTIASDATASAQRSAIFDTACNTGWIVLTAGHPIFQVSHTNIVKVHFLG